MDANDANDSIRQFSNNNETPKLDGIQDDEAEEEKKQQNDHLLIK